MAKNTIYLPTPAACEDVGLHRFPAKYASSAPSLPSSTGFQDFTGDTYTTPSDVGKIGVQYEKFGDTKYAKSLQNLLLKEYFNPKDIVIEVLTNRPYTIKTQTSDDGKITRSIYDYGDKVPESEYEIHISPCTDGGFELDINHNHTWGASASIFDKILKAGVELMGNVDDFITKTKNIAKAVSKDGNRGAYKATPNRRVDVAETYESSEKQSITIPFVLFTAGGEENFIRDIYAPIMTLTRISYPKRSTSLGDTDRALADTFGIGKKSGDSGTDGNGQPSTKDDESIMNALNAINPGFRTFVSDPPSYVNVSHNGGLFSYKNCYISKFSYKYKHWVDGDSDFIKKSGGPDSRITDFSSKNANIGYPLIAECSLEIKSTEPLFSDDFAALSEQYGSKANRSNQGPQLGGFGD